MSGLQRRTGLFRHCLGGLGRLLRNLCRLLGHFEAALGLVQDTLCIRGFAVRCFDGRATFLVAGFGVRRPSGGRLGVVSSRFGATVRFGDPLLGSVALGSCGVELDLGRFVLAAGCVQGRLQFPHDGVRGLELFFGRLAIGLSALQSGARLVRPGLGSTCFAASRFRRGLGFLGKAVGFGLGGVGLRRSGLLQLLDAFFERRNGLGSLRERVFEFGDPLGLAFDLGLTRCARGFGSALGFGRCIAGTLLCFGRLFELLDLFVQRGKLVRQGFDQLAVVLGRRSSRCRRGFFSSLGW